LIDHTDTAGKFRFYKINNSGKKELEKLENLENSKNESYLILKNLEESLRQFIECELSTLNEKWWKQLIPGDVRRIAEKRKKGDEKRKTWNYEKQPLINYIDFNDYAKIIINKNNWKEIFQFIFHDRNKIESKLNEIEPVRNAISHSRDLDKIEERQLKFYSEEILRAISYFNDNREEILKNKLQIKKSISLPQISVSFDRWVYPLHSTVHLRANMPEVLPGEPIMFQVFNSQGKLLVEKQIDPEKYDNVELKKDGLYEVSFTMEGPDWKVDEEYTVKARHSTTEAESYTRIKARKPLLQSDKEDYLWGSEMILTVIDPDGDRDNQIAETVGERKDSKLTIESSLDKIEHYRLRETGDSTGIFQGVIGFIGVKNDGTLDPNSSEKFQIFETQGTEFDDGFLEVSENDELKITYENATGKSELIVYVVKN